MCDSAEILKKASLISGELLPSKSKYRYEAAFEQFMRWRSAINVETFSENVFLVYFEELSKKYKASTLWSTFSMLKTILNIKENINLGKYMKLQAFLKRKSENYVPKKSAILTEDDFSQFLETAPDETFLLYKIKINKDILEELLFFSETKFSERTIEDMGSNRLTFALLFKRSNENLTGNIDDVVLQLVYGNSRKPPGDDRSPALKLLKVWSSSGKHKDWVDLVGNLSEEEIKEAEKDLMLGIWAPPNSLSKAMVLKLLFPNISNPFKMPDLKEIPLHVAVAYDAFKAKDIFELGDKYPGKIISFGYFSSDLPGEAKLLGKTTEKFESRTATVTYEEKLVIQLAKEDPQCFMDFMDLGPSYMSTDVEVGVLDCQYFFPPGYNTPESEIITYLKKKTKRKGKIGKFRVGTDQLQDGDSQSVITGAEVDSSVADLGDQNGEDTVIGDDANNEEAESDEDELEDADKGEEDAQNADVLEIADKATSPVTE